MHFISPQLYELAPTDFVFDYSSRVSAPSFIAMILGLLLLAVPVIWLIVRLFRRFRLEAIGFGLGMVAGLVSMVLFPLVVSMLVSRVEALSTFMNGSSPAKAVVYALLNIIPVFAVIYFGLKLCTKKIASPFANACMFAVGMGIIPMLTSAVPNLMSYLSAAMNINQGKMESLIQAVIDQGESTAEEIQLGLDTMTDFITTTPFTFVSEPLGLTLQMVFYIGVCILTGGYLAGKAPKASLFKAMGLTALFGAALIAEQLVESTALAVAFNIGLAVCSLALAWLDLRAYLHEDWKRFLGKPDPSVRKPEDKNEQPKKRMPKIVMPKD